MAAVLVHDARSPGQHKELPRGFCLISACHVGVSSRRVIRATRPRSDISSRGYFLSLSSSLPSLCVERTGYVNIIPRRGGARLRNRSSRFSKNVYPINVHSGCIFYPLASYSYSRAHSTQSLLFLPILRPCFLIRSRAEEMLHARRARIR